MSQEYLRVFRPFDVSEVQKHLLIMGDLSAGCGACKELGLDVYSVGVCPHCNTAFKYLTSRRFETNPGERFQFARRMSEKRPDLIIIDWVDYNKVLGQKTARDFFG